ncbi:MAG: acyl carrier protein [Chloroflexota bacterium]
MAVEQSIEEKVKEIVTRIVRKSESDFDQATSFKELDADSLDIVQILVAVEDTFEIEMDDEELQEITTLEGFVDYIKRKVAEKE